MLEQPSKPGSAIRWRVIVTVTLVGLAAGVSGGLLAAPDTPTVAVGFGLATGALGALVGVLLGWRPHPPAASDPLPAGAPPHAQHVAEPPPPWPLAHPPPGADPAPVWYPDPRGEAARRYWDGEQWTEHRWQERPTPRRGGRRAREPGTR